MHPERIAQKVVPCQTGSLEHPPRAALTPQLRRGYSNPCLGPWALDCCSPGVRSNP